MHYDLYNSTEVLLSSEQPINNVYAHSSKRYYCTYNILSKVMMHWQETHKTTFSQINIFESKIVSSRDLCLNFTKGTRKKNTEVNGRVHFEKDIWIKINYTSSQTIHIYICMS